MVSFWLLVHLLIGQLHFCNCCHYVPKTSGDVLGMTANDLNSRNRLQKAGIHPQADKQHSTRRIDNLEKVITQMESIF